MSSELIDTTAALQDFLSALPACDGSRPDLYIDLEGNDLCRQGTLSLLNVFVESRKSVHLIDVTELKDKAFSTAAPDGRTLKSLLESDHVIKVFFDIRNDSDALFSHYGVAVCNIQDVQLMELASRSFSKRCVNGLAKCIENDASLGYSEKQRWRAVKERGQRICRSGPHGYAIFDRRPLSDDLKEYCAQDVVILSSLRDTYRAKLCNAWWRKIEAETVARIELSHGPSYNGKGRHSKSKIRPRMLLDLAVSPQYID